MPAKKGKGAGKKGKKGKDKKKAVPKEVKPPTPPKPFNGYALIYKYAFDNEVIFLKSIPELELVKRNTYVLFKEPLPPKPDPEPLPEPVEVKKPPKKKKDKGKKGKGKKGKSKKDGAAYPTGGKGKKDSKGKGKGKKGKAKKEKKVIVVEEKEEEVLPADDPVDGVLQTYLAVMQQEPFSKDINYITVDVHDIHLLQDKPLEVKMLPTFLKWGHPQRLQGTKECTDIDSFSLFVDDENDFLTSDCLLLVNKIPEVKPPTPPKPKPAKKKGKGKGKGKKGKGKGKGKKKK